MDPKDLIRQTLRSSDAFIDLYLNGMDSPDLLVAAVPGMNPIAWQMGHLISVERAILNALEPGASPDLPAGFEEAHGKGKGQEGDPASFAGVAEYRALWQAQRAATMAALDRMTEADLEQPNPVERLRHRATTVGEAFNFLGLHTMLHVGQFVAVRRCLAKPVAL